MTKFEMHQASAQMQLLNPVSTIAIDAGPTAIGAIPHASARAT
mgnify:CR=1 FL=1